MSTQPLYREVLRQAWHLAWRHKILWAFGLFAAVLGTGGALEVLARTFNSIFNPRPWGTSLVWSSRWQFDLAATIWGLVLLLLLLGLAVFLVFVIVNSFSSLILAADQFKAGKKPDWKKIWLKAVKKFWPVLGAMIFFKVLMAIFAGLSIVPLWLVLINQAGPLLLFAYPFLFVASVLLVLISSFLMIYAADYILLENYKWGEAVEASAKLFFQHWLVNLEMALIIFLLNFVAWFLLLVGLLLVAIPAGLVFLFAYLVNLPPLAGVAVFLALFLATFLILWLAAVFGAFHYTAWTLLWRRMHNGTAVSKLVRIVKMLFKKV